MEDKLITYETAKLAKEKGFNQDINTYYKKIQGTDKISLFTGSVKNNSTLAPTQSLLQRWLREKHNIRVLINQGLQHDDFMYSAYFLNKISYVFRTNFYETYEEALETGLQKALNLI